MRFRRTRVQRHFLSPFSLSHGAVPGRTPPSEAGAVGTRLGYHPRWVVSGAGYWANEQGGTLRGIIVMRIMNEKKSALWAVFKITDASSAFV